MINAYQHAGIGVHDAGVTYKFYKDLLGFKVKANDATCYQQEMESVVGALVEMRIIMAANAMGEASSNCASTPPPNPWSRRRKYAGATRASSNWGSGLTISAPSSST